MPLFNMRQIARIPYVNININNTAQLVPSYKWIVQCHIYYFILYKNNICYDELSQKIKTMINYSLLADKLLLRKYDIIYGQSL